MEGANLTFGAALSGLATQPKPVESTEIPPLPRLLEAIAGPADVKALAPGQLARLAQELREEIIAVTAAWTLS